MTKPADAMLTVPGVGELRLSAHAHTRMEERGVTLDELTRALSTDTRKLLAALKLISGASSKTRGTRLSLGGLRMVLGRDDGVPVIVTLWGVGTRSEAA